MKTQGTIAQECRYPLPPSALPNLFTEVCGEKEEKPCCDGGRQHGPLTAVAVAHEKPCGEGPVRVGIYLPAKTATTATMTLVLSSRERHGAIGSARMVFLHVLQRQEASDFLVHTNLVKNVEACVIRDVDRPPKKAAKTTAPQHEE
jgi:hypothetical protein